jgi:hypothetical protein
MTGTVSLRIDLRRYGKKSTSAQGQSEKNGSCHAMSAVHLPADQISQKTDITD